MARRGLSAVRASVLDARVNELAADETWTEYVFPSPQGETLHVTRDTIWNGFQTFAAEAELSDVSMASVPSPQLSRRFWYDTYTAILKGVLEGVDEIAAEQGSSDPQVVMQNYLFTSAPGVHARTVDEAFGK